MSQTIVLPGQRIPIPSSSSSIILGPGIDQALNRTRGLPSSSPSAASDEPVCIATRLGVLNSGSSKGKSKHETFWVEGSSKRYIPAQKDMVLGTIIARHAEGYRVDLGAAQMAQLDALAFEGATKRSKPNLKVGTLVYARVISHGKDMEPELECFDPNTGKAEGFGELKGGLMVTCSLQLCRSLLDRRNIILPSLAATIPFEIAVGFNGRVWFKAETVSETIAMKRVIEGVNDGAIPLEEGAVKAKVQEYMA